MISWISFLILVAMFFAHLVDDYYLQGWLASGKQKSWWEKNAPDPLYRHDYKMALSCHAMSWSIMISAPIIIYSLYAGINLDWFLLIIPVNMAIHAVVDDLKANRHKINLIADQSIHFSQILLTWLLFILIFVM